MQLFNIDITIWGLILIPSFLFGYWLKHKNDRPRNYGVRQQTEGTWLSDRSHVKPDKRQSDQNVRSDNPREKIYITKEMINMSEATGKWQCSECENSYDTKEEAKECCDSKATKIFKCSECNETHDTEQEAKICCKDSDLTTLRNKVGDLIKALGQTPIEITSTLFDDGTQDYGTNERVLSHSRLFFRFLKSLKSVTNEVYIFKDDDNENITLWFITPNEIVYSVVLADADDLTSIDFGSLTKTGENNAVV